MSGSLSKIPFTPLFSGGGCAPKVHKDECCLCFHSPEFPDGLYICLENYFGFCRRHVGFYAEKNGRIGFLHFVRIRKKVKREGIEDKKQNDESDPKITKLAIGVEGGFMGSHSEYEFDDRWTVVVYPNLAEEIQLGDERILPELRNLADSLITSEGALKMQILQSGTTAWDGGAYIETKYSDLKQIENPPKVIPSAGLQCEWPIGCDKSDNLWLNLTTGMVLCGRKNFDGSGGNGHALEYYEQTRYPLAVKIGTITPEGADVFSYDEDEMVIDKNLKKHLAHFGIDMARESKTEKTMLELELDLNLKFEYARIQEEGAKLKPIWGPGYTGILNLGSSCYISSVLQILAVIPEFRRCYFEEAGDIFEKFGQKDPQEDFNLQFSKVITGMLSGDYAPEAPLEIGESQGAEEGLKKNEQQLANQYYQSLLGKGHPEFSTMKQQDAEEYIHHLFSKVEGDLPKEGLNPVNAFKFKVRYDLVEHVVLPLPIPVHLADNLAAVAAFEEKKRDMEAQNKQIPPEQVIRPKIQLRRCFEAFGEDQVIEEYTSTVTGEKTVAMIRIQIKKFTLAEDGSPKKLDAEIQVDPQAPVELEFLRGRGLQEGEEMLPNVEENESSVCDEAVSQLVMLGFGDYQARYALKHCKGNVEEAADLLFNEGHKIPTQPETKQERSKSSSAELKDGEGRYRLRGFISHMGSSTHRDHP